MEPNFMGDTTQTFIIMRTVTTLSVVEVDLHEVVYGGCWRVSVEDNLPHCLRLGGIQSYVHTQNKRYAISKGTLIKVYRLYIPHLCYEGSVCMWLSCHSHGSQPLGHAFLTTEPTQEGPPHEPATRLYHSCSADLILLSSEKKTENQNSLNLVCLQTPCQRGQPVDLAALVP